MFKAAKANEALEFIRSLKHVKSPWNGIPFTLQPWQTQIAKDVFGTLRPDGFRQYRYVYVEIPKKQGKSEFAAALALQGLCADGEYGAEVYGCAGDRQQASIVFDTAVDMIDQDEELKGLIIPKLAIKRLVYKPTRSFYQVLSHEAFTKHGLNVSRCIFDELHAQPKRDLWDVMTKGAGDARSQPLWFVITTAGDDPDRVSIGWEVHEKARKIREGIIQDPRWYVVMYGLDESDDPGDEENWKLVNPSLGHTTKIEDMRAEWSAAKEIPAERRLFLQLRLNVWVTSSRAQDWLSSDLWDATAGMVNAEKLKGRRCFGGLDLSSKSDITAFVLVFPPTADDPKWYVLPRFWIPEEGIKQAEERDGVPYRSRWVPEGLVTATPGPAIDYARVRNDILQLSRDYEIAEIGADQWNLHKIGNELEEEGLTVLEVAQNIKAMSPVMKELERLIRQRELVHGGNPVLRWMFNNIKVKYDDNDNLRPTKRIKTGRVDGIFALLDALSRAMVQPDDDFWGDGVITVGRG